MAARSGPIVKIKSEGIDPYFAASAGWWISLVNEKLGIGDWALDRSVFNYDTLYLPEEVLTGSLAESWETPDPLTYVVKIRKGIKWHNKAPVNGRSLTAHDVEYSWQRILGLDGGEPSQTIGSFDIGQIEWDSITATDDSTVVFKLGCPQSPRSEDRTHRKPLVHVRARPRGGQAIRGHSRLAQRDRNGAL